MRETDAEQKINLNDLLERAKQEKKRDHKNNILIVVAVLSLIILATLIVKI